MGKRSATEEQQNILQHKKQIKSRAAEIIQDYLIGESTERYAYISMYFEKENGEHQHKILRFGCPSEKTPDMYRDSPQGYNDKPENMGGLLIALSDVLSKRIVWQKADGSPWDGRSLTGKKIRDT